ncbi:S1C family serine protease [Streptomyces sp. NPDC057638]|uniref:S1C family serine protease n=1 Tax=Streptomyces sp. NPDC057638 TaxID=3346190 RepID=UPI0036966CF6
MTDHYREQPYQPQAYDTAYPPRPTEPPQPVPHRRRRARGPVALLLTVAVVAATVGGGTALLAGELREDPATGGASPVTGTQVSTGSLGTVAGVAQAVTPSIVEINAGRSTGSGVISSADGEVITNAHVLSGAKTVQVRLSDGTTRTADVLGTAPEKDLALIKIRGASGLKAATLGDSKDLRVGQEVVAIGSPEGLTNTVTSGIISALDRDVTVAKEPDAAQRQQDQRWPFEFGGQQFNGDTGESTTTYKAIQTDASLNPGNSGGALIDMRGQIIGINSAIYAPAAASGASAGSVGLGFAIPVDTVKAELNDLRGGAGTGNG